jgi:hypothetical protein
MRSEHPTVGCAADGTSRDRHARTAACYRTRHRRHGSQTILCQFCGEATVNRVRGLGCDRSMPPAIRSGTVSAEIGPARRPRRGRERWHALQGGRRRWRWTVLAMSFKTKSLSQALGRQKGVLSCSQQDRIPFQLVRLRRRGFVLIWPAFDPAHRLRGRICTEAIVLGRVDPRRKVGSSR